MLRLGVNIYHVATVRQARRGHHPDPVTAAALAIIGGADGITVHLREDRRHIQERDVRLVRQTITARLNLEMAAVDAMTRFALEVKPDEATLVPEKREELTTEGGLNVHENLLRIKSACHQLADVGIEVSLFIDADKIQIDAAVAAGAPVIELHTGHYADATTHTEQLQELLRIQHAAHYAKAAGLQVNAGHGLHFHNVEDICAITEIVELNIGHAIIAQSVFSGLEKTVSDLKKLMEKARLHTLQ